MASMINLFAWQIGTGMLYQWTSCSHKMNANWGECRWKSLIKIHKWLVIWRCQSRDQCQTSLQISQRCQKDPRMGLCLFSYHSYLVHVLFGMPFLHLFSLFTFSSSGYWQEHQNLCYEWRVILCGGYYCTHPSPWPQTDTYTRMCAMKSTLVWGSLRLAPIN